MVEVGTLRDKNLPAHQTSRGDSKIDGPYLDDLNAARDARYTNSKVGRKAKTVKRSTKKTKKAAVAKKAAEAKQQ